MQAQHPDLRLTIVGDGPDRPALEAQAERLGVNGLVHFVGYQSQEAVANILELADMLTLPSLAEGVPVVLMEAMASRLPVIASRVAGVPELVEDGVSGLLAPPGDVEALVYALEGLLGDVERCIRMGWAGRAKVEADFAVEIEAHRMLALFTREYPIEAVSGLKITGLNQRTLT